MLERNTVPNHNHRQSAANDTHPSVVLVMLRLHIARPFQMVSYGRERIHEGECYHEHVGGTKDGVQVEVGVAGGAACGSPVCAPGFDARAVPATEGGTFADGGPVDLFTAETARPRVAEALSALVPRRDIAGCKVAFDPGNVAVGHGPVGWNRRPVCRGSGHRVHTRLEWSRQPKLSTLRCHDLGSLTLRS